MKMREAPWSAAAELPPWNPNQKAVAGATALHGAFGTTLFKAARNLAQSPYARHGNLLIYQGTSPGRNWIALPVVP